jgi:Fe2+ or Zn2+ uptake regulation protein
MKTDQERLAWALEACGRAQVRMTPVRRAILSFVAVCRTPVNLDLLEQADGVRGQCDATTVYRTLILFRNC